MASKLPRHIEYRALDEILTAQRNAKGHNTALIGDSIGRLGFLDPMIEDGRTGRLVAGHGRLEHLQARLAEGDDAPDGVQVRGGRWYAPVTVGWSSADDAEAEAAGLVLNRATEAGGWDDSTLAAMLADQPDPSWLGWDEDELAALLADDGSGLALGETETGVDPDEMPDDVPPLSRLGDLWLCGEHRVVCGDSTDPDVVARVMAGGRAAMVWTDPPYGVAIVGGNHSLRPEERLALGGKTIENDALDADQLGALLSAAFKHAVAVTDPGGAWFVAAPPGPLFTQFGIALNDLGIWRQTLVWLKDSLVMGRSDYHYRHEAIFYGWAPGGAHRAPPDRTWDTIFEVPRPKASKDHPTMKPVQLITPAISNHTDPGGIVFDPFGGSGSTLVAAHIMKRRARVIELDPRYADVICRRFQEVSGEMPAREDGEPVDFIGSQP